MKFPKRKVAIIIPLLLVFILLYTRFVGINWGQPFPMHPDERNMVVAITQLSCNKFWSVECFNPHFYAYGQFPLYLAFFLSSITSFFIPFVGIHEHVVLALRSISAVASVFTVVLLIKILSKIISINTFHKVFLFLIAIFVPVFIQFAHFGTTESLLMFFYTALIYLTVLLNKQSITLYRFVLFSGIVLGIAIGTKVSSIIFAAIPFLAMLMYTFSKTGKKQYIYTFIQLLNLLFITFVIFFLSSPYNFFGWKEFIGSMRYESDVGLGIYRAFYTRQFEYAIPFLFQYAKIFPFSLGWPVTILFLLGFVLLPYNKVNNFLRIQFLLFFIPNSLVYAKWSRFLAPVFPLIVLFALLAVVRIFAVVNNLFRKRLLFIQNGIVIIIIVLSIIPGIAYLSIYTSPDVRFEASKWVYTHMAPDSYILSETANVVDIPVPNNLTPVILTEGKHYNYISFNFYDIHLVPTLKAELEEHISRSDYIFIPSRRVFANQSCYLETGDGSFSIRQNHLGYDKNRCEKLRKDYPDVNKYYDRLFSGNLGFKKVAEFSSFPKISIFGKTLIEFPDEEAEETWTVFDHPVIRIYKRI